jgi:hypothetical protein
VYLQSVNNTQNTNITSVNTLATAAYGKANAEGTINTTQNTWITNTNTFAQASFNSANAGVDLAGSAYVKANNALANTTGIFDGDLTVTGNVVSNYGMVINNSNMQDNGIFLLITGSTNDAYGIPSNPGYTIQTVGPDGQGNRIVAEAYSNTASHYASFIGRRARGTAETPAATESGDIIVRFGGNGYGATKFSQFADARIEFVTTQNHTDTEKGTEVPENTMRVGKTLNRMEIEDFVKYINDLILTVL